MSRRDDVKLWVRLLQEGVMLKDIASEFNISPAVVSTSIKNYTGKTPREWQGYERMVRFKKKPDVYIQTYYDRTFNAQRFFKEKLGVIKCR